MTETEMLDPSERDMNRARYQTYDLKPCPFCGKKPLSASKINKRTLNIVAEIFCPDCL